MRVTNEAFALRSGEVVRVSDTEPEARWRYLAVMLRTVTMPPGERQPERQTDGAKVEQLAILACERVDGKWQWVQLSPPTKEAIGDYMLDSCECDQDKWHFLHVLPAE